MTRSSAPIAPDLPPDALALLQRLAAARVEHVLIGDLALAAHGLAWVDNTVVFVPARFGRNMERLSAVIRDLGARGIGTGESTTLSVDLTPAGLRRMGRWRLRSELGDLEIDFEPPATAGHLDLFEGARRITVRSGLEVEVASLGDLRRIAEIRKSPADLVALQTLQAAKDARAATVAQGLLAAAEAAQSATGAASAAPQLVAASSGGPGRALSARS
jgi:hypothetical protein